MLNAVSKVTCTICCFSPIDQRRQNTLVNMAANAVFKGKAGAAVKTGSSCIGTLGPNRTKQL
jgi:hypothetical protein